MTKALFLRMSEAAGFQSHEELLELLGGKRALTPATQIPTFLSLTTQKANPQWADYRDFLVGTVPWAMRCRITTNSPYFRFGFKLLGLDGRAFGDGSIRSHDANMIVHIGRNHWDRPALNISARDIFLTAYMSGNSIGENDRLLFRSGQKLEVAIELKVDRSYCVSLTVDRDLAFRQIVPPLMCRRVIVYAWGDREEFQVEVTNLAIQSI